MALTLLLWIKISMILRPSNDELRKILSQKKSYSERIKERIERDKLNTKYRLTTKIADVPEPKSRVNYEVTNHELVKIREQFKKEKEAIQRRNQIGYIEEESVVEVEEPVINEEVKEWDFTIKDKIPYFDISCSYELTGYRPINEIEGLDFEIEPFIQTRRTFEKTGKYCAAKQGTLDYNNFWFEEYRRCHKGYTVGRYTITGDHYFFINYYQLPKADTSSFAGSGRTSSTADFYVAQYEYFHYIELCKRLRKDCVALKGRGLGWSEIAAAITTNTYVSKKKSRSLIVAAFSNYLERTLSKVWEQIDYLNYNTGGGMFKPLGVAQPLHRWSFLEELKTRVKKGWLSQVQGIIADNTNKIRGDRVDLLLFEEFGSFPNSLTAFIKGEALCIVNGVKSGIKIGFGTGGDKGSPLAGLKKIFYAPDKYNVLPMRHNYTRDKGYILTGFFIPSYRIVTHTTDSEGQLIKIMDNRGYTTEADGRKHYDAIRNHGTDDKDASEIKAEYCYIPDEAFALEGENDFNKHILAEQLTRIREDKVCPPIFKGSLEYTFIDGKHEDSHISGVKFIPNNNGKVLILEHPIKDNNNQHFTNLYVAGIDAIDMGMSETSTATRDPSNFCVVIKKRMIGLEPPKVVAIYKDRPNDIREAYRTALKLLQYYNSKAVLEFSKIGFKQFLDSKNLMHKYLMRRTRATMTDQRNSRQFGVPATAEIIQHQLGLIKNFIEDYGEEIWFEDMLEELLQYSIQEKRKFDIVAALGMACLADEELNNSVPISETSQKTSFQEFGYYTDSNGIRRFGSKSGNENEFIKVNMDVVKTSLSKSFTSL